MQSKIKLVFNHPLVWIYVFGAIAFWQVPFLYSSLHWDMLDVHLPWLYYMSEVLKSGELHYWNPYQELGYPFHADLQATWYPLALITARFVGFNLYTLHYYFLLHIIIAGYAMYKLSTCLGNEKRISLMGAISYMLCGIFISNAQHLFIITSAAWIPFVLYYFLRVSASQSFLDVLKLSVVSCLMITGGYAFLTIALFYFLLILWVVSMFKYDRSKILKTFSLYLLGMLLIIIMCAPMLISLIQVLPVLERGSPLTAETAISFPYTFHALSLSLIPFALGNNWEFFGTDISMVNIYIGLIFSVFFVYGLFRKATYLEYTFIIFGTFCLLAALAKELPLMKWMIEYVPLFNYFRFPALLRLFFVIGLIIFSLKGLRSFLLFFERDKKLVTYCILSFITLVVLFILYSLFKIDIYNLTFLKQHATFQSLLMELTLYERIFIGGSVQLIILLLLLFILLKGKTQFSFLRNAFLLLAVDLFLSVQMNINYTVVDPAMDPVITKQALEAITPRGFPIPKRTTMLNAKNEGTGILGIWRNTNIFTKEPAMDAFSSFWLNDYIRLEKDTRLGKQVLDNPLVYLSSSVFSYTDLAKHKQNGTLERKNIYVPDEDYSSLRIDEFSHSKTDTAYFLQFGPNKFRIKVISSGEQVLTLMQSAYKGWKVSVSGKEKEWFKSNYLFMSVLIPKGEYEVLFTYENAWIKTGFTAAAITFFTVVMAIVLLALRNRKSKEGLVNQ